MQRITAIILFIFAIHVHGFAQEAFTITRYDVNVKVNKDASLNVEEVINVHFNEPRHGIIRKIPFKYRIQPLPSGTEKAKRQLESTGFSRTIIQDIKVPGRTHEVKTEGDYKTIKIGSKDVEVTGNQQYNISYRVLNAINFFKDHSELYFNLIGNEWATTIASVNFKVELYDALRETPFYFVATGNYGSQENKTNSIWTDNTIFSGHTTQALQPYEGLTIGITLPHGFLVQPDYRFYGIYWLLLPVLVFTGMFYVWKKWGKDEKVTVQTEFYPPENVSPSVSGYIIDDKLDRRDLTALVPYWGAGGFLKINEIEKSALLGLVKNRDYEFIKLKELPATALEFEKTLFNGIFKTGDQVKLSSLKDVLYETMNLAKSQLEREIDNEDYYVRYSRGMGCFFPGLGVVALASGAYFLVVDWMANLWLGVALLVSAAILVILGLLMTKKTKKGTALYQRLLGFKEFLKTVEKDRLKEFLKQDENYFDKVLPYAIVFDIADTWKDKLKGLDIPPPQWYSGNYAGANFNTYIFMNSLDRSMNAMSSSFYSSPHSSGSSGGSFSGGGGFSGGGFGGGGGSSW